MPIWKFVQFLSKTGIFSYGNFKPKVFVLSDTTNLELLACKVSLSVFPRELAMCFRIFFIALMEYFHPIKLLTLEVI